MPVTFQGWAAVPWACRGPGQVGHGVGDSVHDAAMADAYGEVLIVTTGGQIRQSVAELTGIDVVKGLSLLINKSQATTPLEVRGLALHSQGRRPFPPIE